MARELQCQRALAQIPALRHNLHLLGKLGLQFVIQDVYRRNVVVQRDGLQRTVITKQVQCGDRRRSLIIGKSYSLCLDTDYRSCDDRFGNGDTHRSAAQPRKEIGL